MDLSELSASLPPSHFGTRHASRVCEFQDVLDHHQELTASMDSQVCVCVFYVCMCEFQDVLDHPQELTASMGSLGLVSMCVLGRRLRLPYVGERGALLEGNTGGLAVTMLLCSALHE